MSRFFPASGLLLTVLGELYKTNWFDDARAWQSPTLPICSRI